MAARLKILFLPSWYPSVVRPTDGIFIRDQARVVAQVHDVAVLVPGVSSITGLWDRRRRQKNTAHDEDGIWTHRVFAQSFIPYSRLASQYTLYRAATEGFRFLVSEWGVPDVIHAHVSLPCGWIAVRIGSEHGIPVVVTEHMSPFTNHLRSWWSRRLTRMALQPSGAVVALSPSLASAITGFCPAVQPHIIGEVLGDPRANRHPLRKSHRPGRPRIAFVGGLRPQKGVGFLLEAAALLANDGVELDLELGGDGPLRPLLEQKARELGLESRCRFLGQLTRNEVFDLFDRSDLAAVPSLHETFCLAAAEALACGLPVVATRCGGPEYFVNSTNGCTVRPASAEDLAAGIRQCVARLASFDPSAIRNEVLSEFGPERFLQKVTGVYRFAMASGPPRLAA